MYTQIERLHREGLSTKDGGITYLSEIATRATFRIRPISPVHGRPIPGVVLVACFFGLCDVEVSRVTIATEEEAEQGIPWRAQAWQPCGLDDAHRAVELLNT